MPHFQPLSTSHLSEHPSLSPSAGFADFVPSPRKRRPEPFHQATTSLPPGPSPHLSGGESVSDPPSADQGSHCPGPLGPRRRHAEPSLWKGWEGLSLSFSAPPSRLSRPLPAWKGLGACVGGRVTWPRQGRPGTMVRVCGGLDVPWEGGALG